MLYTIQRYPYYVSPVIRVIEELEITATTWKYDHNQEYFNFEVQFQLENVKDYFEWEAGAFFLGDTQDVIENISSVLLRDGLLVIGGWKSKENK